MARDPTSFAQATAIAQQSSHTYRADFPQEWCIGTVPHGGFVASCFMRVASLHFATTCRSQDQPNTIAMHLEYLRRTEIGPATFTVKDMKLGRQTSSVHILLSQEVGGKQREEVVGYFTQSNLKQESGLSFSTDWKLDTPAAPATHSLFLSKDGDPNWQLMDKHPFANFRKVLGRSNFMIPRHGQQQRSTLDEWLGLKSGENLTNESLGLVCDTFPQLIESHLEEQEGIAWKDTGYKHKERVLGKAPYWYPTVLLNLDVKKALPAGGVPWLFVRVRAKQIKNGRYDIEVIIVDMEGDLVALSHHVCLILDASRNLAKRSGSQEASNKQKDTKL